MLLAHINKASAIGGRSAGAEDYSGSTAWHNSVRSRLSLIPDGDDALKVEHLKANLGAKANPVRLEWHDGVPLVAGSYGDVGKEAAAAIRKAAERQRTESDMAAIVEIVRDFDKRGELVTTSVNGGFTVFKLLKSHPGFPAGIGSDRLANLLRELETAGMIYRRTVRTPNRKWKEVFTCTKPADESAPNAADDPCPEPSEQGEGALNA
jgi:hypothetical protein